MGSHTLGLFKGYRKLLKKYLTWTTDEATDRGFEDATEALIGGLRLISDNCQEYAEEWEKTSIQEKIGPKRAWSLLGDKT